MLKSGSGKDEIFSAAAFCALEQWWKSAPAPAKGRSPEDSLCDWVQLR